MIFRSAPDLQAGGRRSRLSGINGLFAAMEKGRSTWTGSIGKEQKLQKVLENDKLISKGQF